MYFDWTFFLLIPGLLLGLWAQAQVKNAYARYSRVATRAGLPADAVVRDLLCRNGNPSVQVNRVSGQLTDHYNPANNTLSLSEGVYGSSSVAALGIAAHEAGHALQQREGYAPLRLRSTLVPVCNIGTALSTPLFMAGLIFSWKPLVTVGILLFSLSTLFTLVTLPVEFDASRRALQMLRSGGYISDSEAADVKSMLGAAAMTYVAAAVSSALALLRLVLIARRRD